jgi:hypothetical protein
MAGWIAGAAWGGLVAVAAGAAFAEHDGLPHRAPHGRAAAWVPFDAGGAPDLPSAPGVSTRGVHVYLDVHPDSAGVEVDGHRAGPAHGFVASPLSLRPGLHHLDVVHPGFKPLRLVVDVSGQHAYLLRGRLEPEAGAAEPPGRGFLVAPRR